MLTLELRLARATGDGVASVRRVLPARDSQLLTGGRAEIHASGNGVAAHDRVAGSEREGGRGQGWRRGGSAGRVGPRRALDVRRLFRLGHDRHGWARHVSMRDGIRRRDHECTLDARRTCPALLHDVRQFMGQLVLSALDVRLEPARREDDVASVRVGAGVQVVRPRPRSRRPGALEPARNCVRTGARTRNAARRAGAQRRNPGVARARGFRSSAADGGTTSPAGFGTTRCASPTRGSGSAAPVFVDVQTCPCVRSSRVGR
jgi:hypothetical protein